MEKVERKQRTVSVNFLERVRVREGISVLAFLEQLDSFIKSEDSNGLETLGDIFTAFANTKRLVSMPSKYNNRDKEIINEIFNSNLSPISGTVEAISRSRKHKEESVYLVRISQGENTPTARLYINLNNLENVVLSAGDIMIGTPIDLSSLENIVEDTPAEVEDTEEDVFIEEVPLEDNTGEEVSHTDIEDISSEENLEEEEMYFTDNNENLNL